MSGQGPHQEIWPGLAVQGILVRRELEAAIARAGKSGLAVTPILDVLIRHGMLLPPGGTTRTVYAVRGVPGRLDGVPMESAERAVKIAEHWSTTGAEYTPELRTITEWPDGARLTTPWVQITAERLERERLRG